MVHCIACYIGLTMGDSKRVGGDSPEVQIMLSMAIAVTEI